jgi:hypothetical protein
MGHSRGDVLGLHYEQIAVEQMRAKLSHVVKNGGTNPAQAKKPTRFRER